METNLFMEEDFHFIMPENKEKFETTGDERYIHSITRLVVKTKLRNKSVEGFLMTIMPSVEYIDLTGFKAFDKTHYIGRGKKFTGRIIFHNLEGEFVNGWVYKNGKITHSIKRNQSGVDPVISLRSSGNYDCYEVEYWGWMRTCIDHYYQVNDNPPVFSHTSCDINYEMIGTGEECLPGDGGDGENGENIDGEDGGYGGGGGTYNPPTVNAPKAMSIFRNSLLAESNWQWIENMLEKIISDCVGQALYDGVKEKLNGKKLIIDFNDQDNSSFSFPPSKISLGMNGESNRLFHEIWHAYQSYHETVETMEESLLNQEIEAWYAQYLYVSILPEYLPGSEWYSWYNDTELGIGIQYLKDHINEKGVLLRNETSVYNHIVGVESLFRDMPEYSAVKYPFNYDRSSATNFSNLRRLSADCD